MQKLQYTQLDVIDESNDKIICVAESSTKQPKVIVKAFKTTFPTEAQLASFKHEYTLNHELKLDHLVHCQTMIEEIDKYALIYDFAPGVSLKSWLSGVAVPIDMFFPVALSLVNALEELHSHGVIHKDIKPENILINPDTLEIKFLDLSFATKVSHEIQELNRVDKLEGSLAYMAPEQTGRMNRPVDYRCDYYALGICFYEMLAGKLPFTSNDPLEYIYFHISLKAESLESINNKIPSMLVRMVEKLMEKAPGDRYSSSAGLKSDLNYCYQQWQQKSDIDDFKLGQREIQDKFVLSTKVYGRQEEIQTLLAKFNKVKQLGKACIMITGYSGIGKSTLVREIQAPLIAAKGLFISGKFDQLQRSTPYIALTQAIKHLVQQLLAEPEHRLGERRSQILDAVGQMGQVLIDVFPDLEKILGAQPPIETIPAEASKNRLILYFRRFICSIATQDHPLVLFIDDLQWVDLASLRLIEALITDDDLISFYFIGAYRDNEVDDAHPLITTLINAKDQGVPIGELHVNPLKKIDYQHLLVASLKMEEELIEPLADAVYEKTGGNPFFAKQFLRRLHDENIFHFSHTRRIWTWEIENVYQLPSSDNVVDSMIASIKKLPEASQKLLCTASCIGVYFELKTLSLIIGLQTDEILSNLSFLLEAGLVVKVSLGKTYKFSHDKVQQAASQMLSNEAKNALHLKAGNLLQKEIKNIENSKRLFEVIDHYFHCTDLVIHSNDQFQLANLCYIAGKRSKESTAYRAAVNYLQLADQFIKLLKEKCENQLRWNITILLAEAYFLIGNIDATETTLDILFTISESHLDTAKAYILKFQIYGTIGKSKEINMQLSEAYKLLGIQIPTKIKPVNVRLEEFRFRWHYGRNERTGKNLMKLKATNDKLITILGELVESTMFLLYLSAPHIMHYVHLKYFNYLSKVGVCPKNIALQIITLGWALDTRKTNLREFLLISEAALHHIKLTSKKSEIIKLPVEMMINLYNHFKYPIREIIPNYISIKGESYDNGLFFYAAASMVGWIRYLYCSGVPLSDVDRLSTEGYLLLQKIQSLLTTFAHIQQLVIQHMMDAPNIDTSNIAETLDHLYESKLAYNKQQTAVLATREMFFSGDLNQAKLWANRAFDKIRLYSSPLVHSAEHWVLHSIILASQYSTASPREKRISLKLMREMEKELKQWAQTKPENFEHLFLIVQAEIAFVKRKHAKAIQNYKKAVTLAKKGKFLGHIAIAYERAARLYLELDQQDEATGFLINAQYYYKKWGCMLKVRHLGDEFPQYLSTYTSSKDASLTGSITTTTTQFDMISINKASQSIAQELNIDKLLQKILHIVKESAAANRVLLIERIENQWCIVAEIQQQAEKEQFKLTSNTVLRDYSDVHHPMVQYVKRASEIVIIDDVNIDPVYSENEYAKKANLKSLMCIPIIHHSDLIGILYFENTVITNVFTTERVEVLKTLSSQIAISLENARHFDNLQRLYRSTERFVPKAFLELLGRKNIEAIKLGDCIKQNVSVLFTDIRKFTTLLENRDPEDAFKFVNSYWKITAPIIRKNKGFINQFQGDGLLALFPQSANNAVDAACSMLNVLDVFNQDQLARGDTPLDIGIGINTGSAMLGIVGEEERLEPACVSDIANTASRVETLNKTYGTHFLLSDNTVNELEKAVQYQLRMIDKVYLKGRKSPTCLFEYIDWQDQLKDKTIADYLTQFNQAFALYQQGHFKDALALFNACKTNYSDDTVADVLINRCQTFIQHGAPEGWDGTYTLEHK